MYAMRHKLCQDKWMAVESEPYWGKMGGEEEKNTNG